MAATVVVARTIREPVGAGDGTGPVGVGEETV